MGEGNAAGASPGARQSCRAGSALSHSRCLPKENGKVLRQFSSRLSLRLRQSGSVVIRDFSLEGSFGYFSEE